MCTTFIDVRITAVSVLKIKSKLFIIIPTVGWLLCSKIWSQVP